MKKLLCALLCLGMLFGCGGGEKTLEDYKSLKMITVKPLFKYESGDELNVRINELVDIINKYDKENKFVHYQEDNNKEESTKYFSVDFDNDYKIYGEEIIHIIGDDVGTIYKYMLAFKNYGSGDDYYYLYYYYNSLYDEENYYACINDTYYDLSSNKIDTDISEMKIGSLSEDEEISLLKIKEYYNDFYNKYKLNIEDFGNIPIINNN